MRNLFPLLLFFFLCSSCGIGSSPSGTGGNDIIREKIANDAGTFEISYNGASCAYTDLFELSLTAHPEGGHILYDSLPAADDMWGDFRVYSRRIIPEDRVIWHLQPEKTGDAGLRGLEVPVMQDGKLLLIPFEDISISVQSSLLNDTGKPEELILLPGETEKKGQPLLFIFSGSVFIAGIILLLFLKKRKKRKGLTESSETAASLLQRLETLTEDQDFQELERKEQYLKLYRLISGFLHLLSPRFPSAAAPMALRTELDKPSPYNQWALRTLYPLLNTIEDIFYNPAAPSPEWEDLMQHIHTVKECFQYLLKEEGREIV